VRIARALALGGIASRRKSEAHILAGRVTVNGQVVTDLGRQVDTDKDEIAFLGKPLRFDQAIYFLLHKPEGYTTTAFDPHAKKTVYELLPQSLVKANARRADATRVFPVGRLDRDSSGLLLFTNDGDLANRLMHPRYEVEKAYQVELNRLFDPKDRAKLIEGVHLEEGVAKVRRVESASGKTLQLVIAEGKKREVRRILAALRYRVARLCRIRFGPLSLGTLPPGEGRFLSSAEVEALRAGMVSSKGHEKFRK